MSRPGFKSPQQNASVVQGTIKRRIIQCARTIGPGYGVSAPSWHLERAFAAQGHHCGRFTLKDMGVDTTSMPDGKPLAALLRLWRDIVAFSTLGSFIMWWKFRYQKPPGTVVITQVDALYGNLFVVRSLHKGFLRRQRARVWMMLRNPLHSLVLWRDHLRFKGNVHDHFVALSEPNKEELIELYDVDPAKISVIPNGVELDRFRPDSETRAQVRGEHQVPAERLLGIFVGHEFERKGLKVVLQALRKLRQQGILISLLVAGRDDPAQLSEEFADLSDSVAYLGNRDDLERYYAASDLMVMPTAHDISPLVGPEALASGLPILMTDIGGVRSYLSHGENGWIVERDSDDVAEKLAMLHTDRELLAQMSSKARDSVRDRDWPVVAQQFLDLLERLYPAQD